MIDSLTVLRKELLDAVGDRHSLRGFVVQAGVLVLLTGIVVPALDASIWESITAPLMLYVVFPSTLAATLAADAFAGEAERGTIETLLATPLSEASILAGKLSAAVLLVMAAAGTSLVVGLVVASARGLLPATLSIWLPAVVLGGALAGGLLISTAVVVVSLRVPVTRSAQQIGALLTYLVAGVVAAGIGRRGAGLNWPTVFRIEVVVFLAGLATFWLAYRLFRRDVFFRS